MCKPMDYKVESAAAAIQAAIHENISSSNVISAVYRGDMENTQDNLKHAFEHARACTSYLNLAASLAEKNRTKHFRELIKARSK